MTNKVFEKKKSDYLKYFEKEKEKEEVTVTRTVTERVKVALIHLFIDCSESHNHKVHHNKDFPKVIDLFLKNKINTF